MAEMGWEADIWLLASGYRSAPGGNGNQGTFSGGSSLPLLHIAAHDFAGP